MAVLGEQPPADLDQELSVILATGEPTTPPDELLGLLMERRREATKLAPWVERHHRPGKRM